MSPNEQARQADYRRRQWLRAIAYQNLTASGGLSDTSLSSRILLGAQASVLEGLFLAEDLRKIAEAMDASAILERALPPDPAESVNALTIKTVP